jgi:hypothetical protein
VLAADVCCGDLRRIDQLATARIRARQMCIVHALRRQRGVGDRSRRHPTGDLLDDLGDAAGAGSRLGSVLGCVDGALIVGCGCDRTFENLA